MRPDGVFAVTRVLNAFCRVKRNKWIMSRNIKGMILSGIDSLGEKAHGSLKCQDKSHHPSLSLPSLACDSCAIYLSYLRVNVKLIPLAAHASSDLARPCWGLGIIDS